jgi:glucokinase
MRNVVGIDFGATNIKAGLVSPQGVILKRARTETIASQGKDKVISRIVTLARKLGQNDKVDVGVACPGPVDGKRGILFEPPNLPGWKEVHLKKELQKVLGSGVRIENDANMVLYGEWKFGAGQGTRNLLLLTLGTGIGSGLILDGRLYTGANGFAAELGHTVVDPRGPQCRCGARGCLESLAGAQALVSAAKRLIASGVKSVLARSRDEMTVRDIGAAAAMGDEVARAVLAKAGVYVGLAISNAVALLDVEMVIIGGGISRAGRFIMGPLKKTVSANLIDFRLRKLKIVRSRLGDDAGILGIAAYFRSQEA